MPMPIRAIAAVALIAGWGLAAVAPARADETDPPKTIAVTGNAALVSDYRFRGLSRSGGDPAIQGSINVNHSSGFYAGFWASSTDFKQFPPIDRVYGSQELDLYAGWTGPVSSAVTADVGLLYYAYPSGRVGKAEFFEPYASLSTTLGPVSARLGAAYAWKQAALDLNADGKKDDNVYVYGELSGGIPSTPVSLNAHIGYTKGALSPKFATGQTADYAGGLDYSLGATYAINSHLSVGANYVAVDGTSLGHYSDDTVVGTVKLAF